MKTAITTLSKILAAAALLASVGLAQAAGSATADIVVSATIVAKCTISTTPVAFGDYDPVTGTADISATGTVVVGCTKAAGSLWVGLGDGLNGAISARKMKHATLTDTLNYSLVMPTTTAAAAACPTSGGTNWGNTSTTALNLTSPTGYATRTYNVCGQMAKNQDSSVGSYTDTVVATINF